jgi:hypothetical protein
VITYRTMLHDSSNAATCNQIPSPSFAKALNLIVNFEILVFQVMDGVNWLVGTEVFRWVILVPSSDYQDRPRILLPSIRKHVSAFMCSNPDRITHPHHFAHLNSCAKKYNHQLVDGNIRLGKLNFGKSSFFLRTEYWIPQSFSSSCTLCSIFYL